MDMKTERKWINILLVLCLILCILTAHYKRAYINERKTLIETQELLLETQKLLLRYTETYDWGL